MFRCSLTESVVNLRRDHRANPYDVFAVCRPTAGNDDNSGVGIDPPVNSLRKCKDWPLAPTNQRMNCKITALVCPAWATRRLTV